MDAFMHSCLVVPDRRNGLQNDRTEETPNNRPQQRHLQPHEETQAASANFYKVGIVAQERKDKVGERISALQELVSPYGKTDTASVLLEAMGYIKFLQDQVRVLSAPYLQSVPATQEESEYYSLRSRGLCLVPVEWTLKVARSNGADMWAPTMTTTKY